ncbi:MAG TPA: tetratricopeptide repeat protein [Candidatus Obscuribacterales bacterium]
MVQGHNQANRKELQSLLGRAAMAFGAGDDRTARKHYEQALGMIEEYGLDSTPEAIVCMKNLGEMCYADGDLPAALDVYSRLVMSSVSVYGESHRDVIANMFMLAKICDEMEQYEDASSIYARVLKLSERFLKLDDVLYQHIREAYSKRGAQQHSLRQTISSSAEISGLKQVTAVLASTEGEQRAHLMKRNQYLFSAIGSLVMLVLAVFWLQWLSLDWKVGVTIEHKPAAVSGQAFQTPDGGLHMTLVDPAHGQISMGDKTVEFEYTSVNANIDSVTGLMGELFEPKQVWLEDTGYSLVAPEGTTLYLKDTPEVLVVEKMRQVAQALQNEYQQKQTYPQNAQEEWKTRQDIAWINPATRQPDRPTLQIFSQYQITFSDAGKEEEFLESLKNGTRWNDEPSPAPAAIHCFGIYSGEKRGNEYPVNSLYMHGYDRLGRLIEGTTKGTYYYIALVRDKLIDSARDPVKRVNNPLPNTMNGAHVYIAQQGEALFGVVPLKLFAPLLLGSVCALFLLLWLAIDLRQRVGNPKRLPTLIEVLLTLSIAVWIAWYAVRLWPQ